jgi:hypothetical protein
LSLAAALVEQVTGMAMVHRQVAAVLVDTVLQQVWQ